MPPRQAPCPQHAPVLLTIQMAGRHLDGGRVLGASSSTPGARHGRGPLPLGGPLAALVPPATPPARARGPLDLVLLVVLLEHPKRVVAVEEVAVHGVGQGLGGGEPLLLVARLLRHRRGRRPLLRPGHLHVGLLDVLAAVGHERAVAARDLRPIGEQAARHEDVALAPEEGRGVDHHVQDADGALAHLGVGVLAQLLELEDVDERHVALARVLTVLEDVLEGLERLPRPHEVGAHEEVAQCLDGAVLDEVLDLRGVAARDAVDDAPGRLLLDGGPLDGEQPRHLAEDVRLDDLLQLLLRARHDARQRPAALLADGLVRGRVRVRGWVQSSTLQQLDTANSSSLQQFGTAPVRH
eukprot:scaffold46360_cov57-Phaeocystis_antarctica.AAC.1